VCEYYRDEASAVGKSVIGNLKMKPVTGNFTGYRLTGNRLTTLPCTPTAAAVAHNKETRRRCGPVLVKRLARTPPR